MNELRPGWLSTLLLLSILIPCIVSAQPSPSPPDFHFLVIPDRASLELMLNEAAQRGDRLVLLSGGMYSQPILALMRGGDILRPYSYVVAEDTVKDIGALLEDYNRRGFRVLLNVQVEPTYKTFRRQNFPLALLLERSPTPDDQIHEYRGISTITEVKNKSMFTFKSYLSRDLLEAEKDGFTLVHAPTQLLFGQGLAVKGENNLRHGYFTAGGLKHIHKTLVREGPLGCRAGLVSEVFVRCDYVPGESFAYEYVRGKTFDKIFAEVQRLGPIGYRLLPVPHETQELGALMMRTSATYEYRYMKSQDVVALARDVRRYAAEGFSPIWLGIGFENKVVMERPQQPAPEVKP